MTDDTDHIELFLKESLPKCMEKCDAYTKQLVIDGHQELQSHLLNKCQNISKESLSNAMTAAQSQLQERINHNFTTVYQDFVNNHILVYKDAPCVTNRVVKQSKAIYQSCNPNLMKKKETLHQQYTQKQKLLQQINNENIRLQKQLNSTLKSINDSYQSIKSDALKKHQILRELQTNFQHQNASSKPHASAPSGDRNNANRECDQLLVAWSNTDISAALP
eukprot:229244_1